MSLDIHRRTFTRGILGVLGGILGILVLLPMLQPRPRTKTILALLLLLLLLATASSSNASKQRRRKQQRRVDGQQLQQRQIPPQAIATSSDLLDRTFPKHLRSGFAACNDAKLDDGEMGICKLLAAFDTQLQLLNSSSSPSPAASQEPDSCLYRRDGGDRLHTLATSPSPQFVALLERYHRLHAACTALEHSRVSPQDAATGHLQCRYVVWSCTFGLGNRILSLVSTFLYALLSQRVLLLDVGPSWDRLFCSPFVDSPWHLAQGVTFKDDPSPAFASFIADKHRQAPIVPIVFDAYSSSIEHSFLACSSSMAAVRDVPIMFFRNSNQFFAAGFFLNPTLRPILETLFPDRRVFHTIARSLLFPSNEVWTSIASVHSRHLQAASRRLGVQLRESKGEYRDFYDTSVPRCIRARLCPIEIDEFQSRKSKNKLDNDNDNDNEDGFYSVYISSLAGGHALSINSSLTTMEAETGQKFKVVTLGSEGEQKEDVDHQQRALVDIWSLSLSDMLLTSHISTFGYVAQGLAGLTPLLLKPWKKDPCWPSLSSEPCYHFAPARKGGFLELTCEQDNNNDEGDVESKPAAAALTRKRERVAVEVPDYVKPCPDLPDTGMQLSEPW